MCDERKPAVCSDSMELPGCLPWRLAFPLPAAATHALGSRSGVAFGRELLEAVNWIRRLHPRIEALSLSETFSPNSSDTSTRSLCALCSGATH